MLDLSGNPLLGGTLPQEWGSRSFSQLRFLFLGGTGVSGTLPVAWGVNGSFPRLAGIALSQNPGLVGSLPGVWGSGGGLPRLKTLQLDGCGFSGVLPASWGTQLPSLESFVATKNRLGGELISSFG